MNNDNKNKLTSLLGNKEKLVDYVKQIIVENKFDIFYNDLFKIYKTWWLKNKLHFDNALTIEETFIKNIKNYKRIIKKDYESYIKLFKDKSINKSKLKNINKIVKSLNCFIENKENFEIQEIRKFLEDFQNIDIIKCLNINSEKFYNNYVDLCNLLQIKFFSFSEIKTLNQVVFKNLIISYINSKYSKEFLLSSWIFQNSRDFFENQKIIKWLNISNIDDYNKYIELVDYIWFYVFPFDEISEEKIKEKITHIGILEKNTGDNSIVKKLNKYINWDINFTDLDFYNFKDDYFRIFFRQEIYERSYNEEQYKRLKLIYNLFDWLEEILTFKETNKRYLKYKKNLWKHKPPSIHIIYNRNWWK